MKKTKRIVYFFVGLFFIIMLSGCGTCTNFMSGCPPKSKHFIPEADQATK